MLAAKDLKEGQRCVVILPDGLRNYMTKFLSDQWMMERDLFDASDDPSQKHWYQFFLPVTAESEDSDSCNISRFERIILTN